MLRNCTAKSRIYARGRTDFWGGPHFVTDHGDQGVNDLFSPLILGGGCSVLRHKRHVCIVFTGALHSPFNIFDVIYKLLIGMIWYIEPHFYVSYVKSHCDMIYCSNMLRNCTGKVWNYKSRIYAWAGTFEGGHILFWALSRGSKIYLIFTPS